MRLLKRIIIGGFSAIVVLLAGCEKKEKAVADSERTEIIEEVHQVDEIVVDDYWSQSIDSELCQTVGECRDLGDAYGSEHFEEFIRGLEMGNEMWSLNVGTENDEYAFADYDVEDEDLIIARYEIIEDEFVLTQGEEASTFKGIADIVLALYDRNKVNLQFLDFREDVYPYALAKEENLVLPSNLISQWFQADMVAKLIHEYAHLLTMDEAESVISDTCPADQYYFKPYGECYIADSYMNLYYQAFLNGYEEKWLYAGNRTVEGRIAFYEKNKDSFVTTYATINPFEDIAESFSNFMLTSYNASPHTIPERKVNFFYQFPELVEYRAFVLKELKDRKDEMWSFY